MNRQFVERRGQRLQARPRPWAARRRGANRLPGRPARPPCAGGFDGLDRHRCDLRRLGRGRRRGHGHRLGRRGGRGSHGRDGHQPATVRAMDLLIGGSGLDRKGAGTVGATIKHAGMKTPASPVAKERKQIVAASIGHAVKGQGDARRGSNFQCKDAGTGDSRRRLGLRGDENPRERPALNYRP